MAPLSEKAGQDILLKGGLIVDGTGRKAFPGNLLIRAGRVHKISQRPIRADGLAIDCTGRVIAPGFIDAHSHLDWHLPIKGHEELKWPFIAQGITTVVAGNCGLAAAGYREGTTFRQQVDSSIIRNPHFRGEWETLRDYFAVLASMGSSHNVAMLAGHGSTRTSIRGFDPSPLHPYELSELLRLLDTAMAHGARGVSLGLQYEPGMFARPEELKDVALLTRKRGGILAVHMRALSALSGAYPIRPFGTPHNLTALSEMLDLARRTGVSLQLSHLIFVGRRTWKTFNEAMRRIEKAAAEGVDVRFDTYPYHCGASTINVLLSPWFLGRLPGAWEDRRALRRLRRDLLMIERFLGFGTADVQVTDAWDPDFKRYDGMFLTEIGRLRRTKPEDALIEIARRSAGRAKVLCHRYSNESIVAALIRHPLSLFMTDAWVEPSGAQNPAAYGSFPRFLQLAREKRLLTLEETVHKMTGATAERFSIRDRGVLADGKAADITIFDWENVADNNTSQSTDNSPTGIEYVFVNGKKIMSGGKKESPLIAGVPLPA